MIKQVDFQSTIEDAFLHYSASVAQDRAIPDCRDFLKPGLRQGLYAQFTNKLTHKDKFQKAQKSVASAMAQSYVHGDAAMYDAFIRAARPWSMRYPLEDVQGSYGNPSSPDSHAASRYVEMKAGEIAGYMFAGLKKDAVHEWYDNYDNSEKIPSVFPSIGFWNIVNGSQGIAVAMATSVPQFNLREVNNALIKIIKDPSVSFDDIYCAPDFATGGLITNAAEVRESLRQGKGKSIRLRATIKYNPSENMLQATELPYGVFTNTVIDQLAALVNDDPEYGIDKVIDHTKKVADIRFYLSKGQNPDKMIAKLYHDTSLENHYSVNMILLDQGRFPKIFGWRAACDAYISHMRECKRNMIQFDLDKALARENVIEGLLIAAAHIDEVISIIRSSQDSNEASEKLIARFNFNVEQVKAILAIKLASLTKIDSIKLNNELEQLRLDISEYKHLLMNPPALDEKLIEILNIVSEKFGDARRTKVENILGDEEEPEEIKETDIAILRYDNALKVSDLPLKKTVKPQEIYYTTNLGSLTLFTSAGKMYNISTSKLKIGKEYKITEIFECGTEKPLLLLDTRSFNAYNTVTLVTKHGYIKKSSTKEYMTRSKKGVAAIKLEENDSIVAAIPSSDDDDRVAVISSSNYYNCYPLSEVGATGRLTKGIKAIKLGKDEHVIDAKWAGDSEYKNTGRAVKGVKNG